MFLHPPKKQHLISFSANVSPEESVLFTSELSENSVGHNIVIEALPKQFFFDFTLNKVFRSLPPNPSTTSTLWSLCTTPDTPRPVFPKKGPITHS